LERIMMGNRRERKQEAKIAAREACARLADQVDSVPALLEDCPCTKKNCERHGKCKECYIYHSSGRLMPFCLR
jgi:hypothetical protein